MFIIKVTSYAFMANSILQILFESALFFFLRLVVCFLGFLFGYCSIGDIIKRTFYLPAPSLGAFLIQC